MAEIIIDRHNEMIIRCPHCLSTIRFDIKDFYYDDVGHVGDHFVCPACHKRISYSFSRLPQHWKNQLSSIVD